MVRPSPFSKFWDTIYSRHTCATVFHLTFRIECMMWLIDAWQEDSELYQIPEGFRGIVACHESMQLPWIWHVCIFFRIWVLIVQLFLCSKIIIGAKRLAAAPMIDGPVISRCRSVLWLLASTTVEGRLYVSYSVPALPIQWVQMILNEHVRKWMKMAIYRTMSSASKPIPAVLRAI